MTSLELVSTDHKLAAKLAPGFGECPRGVENQAEKLSLRESLYCCLLARESVLLSPCERVCIIVSLRESVLLSAYEKVCIIVWWSVDDVLVTLSRLGECDRGHVYVNLFFVLMASKVDYKRLSRLQLLPEFRLEYVDT